MQRLAVGREYIEISEALHTQNGVVFRNDRKAQLVQLFFDLFLCDGLHDVSARVQLHRVAGIFGKVTGFYQAYYRYGVIFIESLNGAITVNIDLECSGFIEISAFISLLAFYGIYNIPERIYIGVVGTLYTMLTNALRIAVICTMIHFLGTDYYYVAHTIVGRIVFYVLQVILYFFIFTKPHVLKMKTGDFGYNKKEEIAPKSGGDVK